MAYETLLYDTGDAIATITLNRPDRLNTIVPPMPDELEDAVHTAVADAKVKVIEPRLVFTPAIGGTPAQVPLSLNP